MPPAFDDSTESFTGLVLQLRGRIGLTQRELAAQLGVHTHSIQAWESGSSYPGAASLQALVAVALRAGGFTAGREAEEAARLWAAARRESTRLRTPFDPDWFAALMADRREPARTEAPRKPVAAQAAPRPPASGARQSWGEAPDVEGFLARTTERALLTNWVLDERCRVVAILGLGGIGKSLLATRLAHDVAPTFEYVIWRSLRDAPTPTEWLTEVIEILAPDDVPESGGESALLRQLLALLRQARCLLVLDNVETILQTGGSGGGYRPGYERYGTLLRQLGESQHRSCLVVTSREEPPELTPLKGQHGPVRALGLDGFGVDDGRALLRGKGLTGNDASWQTLVVRCGGNGLALKVVGETIRELFNGSIDEYLEYAALMPSVMVGGVRELLRAQIQRLSSLEQALLSRLAVAREPVGLAEIAAEIGPRLGRGAALEAVEGLRRRSLLERTERGMLFSLHSVVLEYVTEQLIEDVARELADGEPDRLLGQPLLAATAKDYVRRSQERLIIAPLLERLVASCGSVRAADERLVSLLDQQRGRPFGDQGYGPGNLVNLLRQHRGDLKGVDLSGLAIRQAYLPEVEAQDVSLRGAHLAETVLGEAFHYPTSLTLSADGTYLVAGTASGEVCRWRVADRTLLANVPGHAGTIWGLALSGDGRLVASASHDGTIRLWEADSVRPLAVLHGHTGGVWGVALDGDGRLLASSGVDGTVRLWDADSGQPRAILRGHTHEVYAVALSEDGRLVASGSLDGTVRLWDAGSGEALRVLQGHTSEIYAVAMSRDGRLVASGSLDGTVRLWDAASGQPLATLQGHVGGVRGVALSGDGRLAASSGFDGTVRLWDTASGEPQAEIHGHAGGVRGVAVNGDGRLVASSGFDGTVCVWESASGLPLVALQGHAGGVWGVAVSGDGSLVASGSHGTVRLWEAVDGRPLATLHGHTGGVWGVALSEDGRRVASSSLDGTVRLWDGASGRAVATLSGHTGVVCDVALSADGRLAASGGFDGTVRLWDAGSGRPLATLLGHTGGVRGVGMSADGRLVASGSVDGTVRLWDAVSGQVLRVLQGHTGGVWSVAVSGDGRLIASGGFDGKGRLWDAETGRMLATLQGHTSGVWGVAVSRDGRTVATGSVDGTARLWDAATGQQLAVLRGHSGGIWGVALSRDGAAVASGGDDGTVRLWAPDTGACLRVLRDDRRYERVDITGLTGVTDAQRRVLLALGAVEHDDASAADPPARTIHLLRSPDAPDVSDRAIGGAT